MSNVTEAMFLYEADIENERLRLKLKRYETALKEIEEMNEYYSGTIASKALEAEHDGL
jgi:hypothetical protein